MFDEMLGIKRIREQQSELALVRQQQRRVEAVQEAEKARDRFSRYRDWAKMTEQSMYRDLCERVVRPREIEAVLNEVADFKKNESHYASAWEAAKERVDEETKLLSDCRSVHADMVRLTEKFSEFAKAYWNDIAQEQNKKEDGELEEMASLIRDRGDWAGSDSEYL